MLELPNGLIERSGKEGDVNALRHCCHVWLQSGLLFCIVLQWFIVPPYKSKSIKQKQPLPRHNKCVCGPEWIFPFKYQHKDAVNLEVIFVAEYRIASNSYFMPENELKSVEISLKQQVLF